MSAQWDVRDNPFQLGLWMPEIGEYQLSVQGSACSKFGKGSVNITMEMPSVNFDKTQSACPSGKYSDGENTVGVFGPNPLFSENDGCSILYNVIQPSYGAYYGFLQIVSDGDIYFRWRNEAESSSVNTRIVRISEMIAPLVVDCASTVNSTCQTIGNQTRVEANKEVDVLYTGGSLFTFTAPYFSPDTCELGSGNIYDVDLYQNFGTWFQNYLMIKVDTQPGKTSYWVPVRRAGWSTSYEVVCPNPPCGTGLGPSDNKSSSSPWVVESVRVSNPSEQSFWSKGAYSPAWNGSFQQSFQVVNKASQTNGSWFYCPTSLDIVHPSSHGFLLTTSASSFFLLLLLLTW